ncbi:hypothetical protein OG568_56595 (plasmid) [Streptomyces sp. NBC_01450]|uniref:hypothetical protein n=1 Tax=Streptomyces sp. NBC_01450 TaxID=2903871 RepID=UPI002E37FE7D|nr:hypothetical protein [Streptomyces sp. NBC_01450]
MVIDFLKHLEIDVLMRPRPQNTRHPGSLCQFPKTKSAVTHMEAPLLVNVSGIRAARTRRASRDAVRGVPPAAGNQPQAAAVGMTRP